MTNKEENHFSVDIVKHYDMKKSEEHDVKEHEGTEARYDAYSVRDKVKERESDNTSTLYDIDARGEVRERESDKTSSSLYDDTNARDVSIALDDFDARYELKKPDGDNTSTLNTNARGTFSTNDGNIDILDTSIDRDVHSVPPVKLDEAEAPTNAKKNDAPSDDSTISPGTRLRQAREQQNLSVKNIADKLYLDVHVIEALETDKHEGLPPTIFIRGYLRNYAKLLDISPESIIASFDHIKKKQQPSPTTPKEKPKKQASSHDFWPTVGTITVVITLMILMALWQFYPRNPEPQPQVGSFTSDNESWASSTPDFPRTSETEPSNLNGVDEPKTSSNSSDSEAEDSVTTKQSNPTDVETSSDEPDMTDSSTPTMDFSTPRVHFKQRAWMRITDASGNRLYEGIGDAGKILPLDGTPPFYLKVGNVDGVEIEYHGEISSIKTYPKRNGSSRTFVVGNDE